MSNKIDREYVCYDCKEIVANGVGPSGLPLTTTILNKLPSSHMFYRDACQHDMDYHRHIGKELADNAFLANMLRRVVDELPMVSSKGLGFWGRMGAKSQNIAIQAHRKFYVGMAYRNFWFVYEFGDEAYADGACEKLSAT